VETEEYSSNHELSGVWLNGDNQEHLATKVKVIYRYCSVSGKQGIVGSSTVD